MTADMMLTIPEETLLAQTRPSGQTFQLGLWAPDDALSAARLIELVLSRRITVGSTRGRLFSKETVSVVDATPTGDPLLDATLMAIGDDDQRTCAHWVGRLANGSGEAYVDRLVERSLLLPDGRGSGVGQYYVPDADALAAMITRIRAVLEEPLAAGLRDVALVTLLGYTRVLFWTLHSFRPSPSALVRHYLAGRRLDERGGQTIDLYRAADDGGRDDPEPNWERAAAGAIQEIARAAQPEGWGGGI